MSGRPMMTAALEYLRMGLSVIPTRPDDKRPLVAWKEFQTRRPTEGEVVAWYHLWPDAGVGIVCGAVSALAVVDFDPRNGGGLTVLEPRLPRTPTVETGGGGRHCYFRFPSGWCLPKIRALLPGVDLQAEASYVVAPPTIHPNGKPYRWLPALAIGEVSLAPLPAAIRQLLAFHKDRKDESLGPRRSSGRDSALTLDSVLPSLRGVRRSGRGWRALCPAHDDREPSLSVAEGHGGKLLLFCHAGCSFTQILLALRGRRA